MKLGCALHFKTYASFRCARVEGKTCILEVVKCVSVERYIQTQRVLGRINWARGRAVMHGEEKVGGGKG